MIERIVLYTFVLTVLAHASALGLWIVLAIGGY